MKDIIICRLCGKQVEVEYTEEQLKKWLNRDVLITDIFPEWTSEQCEMLLSRTCNECWNEIFKEE